MADDDRDRDLERRLRNLSAPEHGPEFWAGLRRDITGRHLVPVPADESTSTPLDALEIPVDHRPPTTSRTPQRLLAAAAAILIGLVAVGFVVTRDDDTAVTTEPDPTAPDPSDPDTSRPATSDPDASAPDGASISVAGPVRSGHGDPVAVDPTGQFLYLTDDDPAGGQGCEGAPAQVLFVEPIGGGERRLAVPDADVPATGGVQVVFGPDGSVVVVAACESFTSGIVTGTTAGDGTIGDPTELQLTDPDSGDALNVVDIAWLPDGNLVASTFAFGDAGEVRRVLSFPAGPSEPTDLGLDGVIRLAVGPDGTLATYDVNGTISYGGEELGRADEVFGLRVSPTGGVVAAFGGSGMELLRRATSPVLTSLVDRGGVSDATYLDDGTIVFRAYGAGDNPDARVLASEAGTVTELLAADAAEQLRTAIPTADGTALVVSVFLGDGDVVPTYDVYDLVR